MDSSKVLILTETPFLVPTCKSRIHTEVSKVACGPRVLGEWVAVTASLRRCVCWRRPCFRKEKPGQGGAQSQVWEGGGATAGSTGRAQSRPQTGHLHCIWALEAKQAAGAFLGGLVTPVRRGTQVYLHFHKWQLPLSSGTLFHYLPCRQLRPEEPYVKVSR